MKPVFGSQTAETAEMKREEKTKKNGDRDKKEVSGRTGPSGGKEVRTYTTL